VGHSVNAAVAKIPQFVDEVFKIVMHSATLTECPTELDGKTLSIQFKKSSCRFWASVSVVNFDGFQNEFIQIDVWSCCNFKSLSFKGPLHISKFPKTFKKGES
jgi:hypothetical protein